MPEDSHRGTNTQAFSQGAEDFPHATGGGLEAIQGRAVTGAEFRPTGLALEIPDVFLAAMATTAERAWTCSSVMP